MLNIQKILTKSGVLILIMSALILSLTACSIDFSSDDDDEKGEHTTFSVTLSGMQEVPMVETAASGWGQLKLTEYNDMWMLSGSVDTYDITATMAHIHTGFAGVSGGVLIGLLEDSDKAGMWSVPEETYLTSEQVMALKMGGLYVNIHSAEFPAGELRGQILSENQEIVHFMLSGMQEVPAVDTDAMGSAWLTLDKMSGDIHINVMTSDLDDASAAHIHAAFAGLNGDVVEPLTQNTENMSHWMLATQLDSTAMDLLKTGRIYVNVHSATVPSGEIRGQIAMGNIKVVVSELTGAQEVPAVTTDAKGVAALTLDSASGDYILHVNTDLDATMGHIHQAAVGANGGVLYALTQDSENSGHWMIAAGSFTQTDLTALTNELLYVNLHSTTHAGGELRGQLIP